MICNFRATGFTVSDSSRDNGISRRRLVWVSLFAAIIGLVAFPSDADAGPLLDWLFQRNRASALTGGFSGSPYAAGYAGTGASGATTAGFGAAASQFGQAGLGQTGLGQVGLGQTGLGQTGLGQNGLLGQNNFGQSSLRPNLGTGGGIFRGQSNSTLFPKCCLFGRGRQSGFASNNNSQNNLAAASGLAGASADPRTTAAFGSSDTGCQSGWCQQTVLRYVPQIAYRTAYQPVPVTTYKTSTTINPTNGLPRTCTRPCTSYSYQARRVPYTTYRPVYTTVPVADNLGANPNAPQQQAGFAPQSFPGQANAQLSAFGAGPACAACQNGNLGTPGYTPGDATFLPPAGQFAPGAGQAGPWSPLSQSGASGFAGGERFDDAPSATPWRPLRGDYGVNSGGADSNSNIPWQRVEPNVGGGEADRRPTLRPFSNSDSFSNENSFADDGYDNYQQQNGGSSSRGSSSRDSSSRGSSTRLRAVPMPREETPSYDQQYDPNRRIDGAQAYRPQSYEFDNRSDEVRGYGSPTSGNRGSASRSFENQSYRSQSYADRSSRDYFDDQPIEQRMFTTPRQTNNSPYNSSFETNETRRPPVDSYRSRAVRDLERERRPYSFDDKTAREVSQPRTRDLPKQDFVRNESHGSRPMLDDEANAVQSSRFAAMPIDWSAVSKTRNVDTQQTSSGWRVR